MNKTFFPWILIGFVIFLFSLTGCTQSDKQSRPMEEKSALEVKATPMDAPAFNPLREALAKLPPGSDILVEDDYRDLIPPSLKAHDFYSYYKVYKYPDTRMDPWKADSILVHESIQTEAICAPPKIWERVVSVHPENGRKVSLLKRTADLSEDFLAPLPVRQRDDMVAIPEGTLGETAVRKFSMDRYEVTHR